MSKTTIFTTDVQLYSTKISFGDCVAQTGRWSPWLPPLELPLVGGNCAYVARGIDALASTAIKQNIFNAKYIKALTFRMNSITRHVVASSFGWFFANFSRELSHWLIRVAVQLRRRHEQYFIAPTPEQSNSSQVMILNHIHLKHR